MTKEEKYLARSMVKTMRHDWQPDAKKAISPFMNIVFLLYKFDLFSFQDFSKIQKDITLIMLHAEPYFKEVRKSRGKLKPKTRRKIDEALRNITTD